jgi:hypothetical protein
MPEKKPCGPGSETLPCERREHRPPPAEAERGGLTAGRDRFRQVRPTHERRRGLIGWPPHQADQTKLPRTSSTSFAAASPSPSPSRLRLNQTVAQGTKHSPWVVEVAQAALTLPPMAGEVSRPRSLGPRRKPATTQLKPVNRDCVGILGLGFNSRRVHHSAGIEGTVTVKKPRVSDLDLPTKSPHRGDGPATAAQPNAWPPRSHRPPR